MTLEAGPCAEPRKDRLECKVQRPASFPMIGSKILGDTMACEICISGGLSLLALMSAPSLSARSQPECGTRECLISIAEPQWVSLIHRPADGVDIRYALVPNEGGCQLLIRNFGATAVSFGYWLQGIQQPGPSIENAPIHISPGAKIRLFLDRIPQGIQVVDVRIQPSAE